MSRGEFTRAAGGAVWRPRDRGTAGQGDGGVEVLVVGRDRYGDWSLPKGKLDPGESHKQAAIREVFEETGVRCELGAKLLNTTYETPLGTKRVKWWEMRPLPEEGDDPGAGDPTEISEVLWLPFETAWRQVTYAADREVLSALASKALGYLVDQ